MAKFSKPLSLLSKAGTAVTIGHAGYQMVKHLNLVETSDIAKAVAFKLFPKVIPPIVSAFFKNNRKLDFLYHKLYNKYFNEELMRWPKSSFNRHGMKLFMNLMENYNNNKDQIHLYEENIEVAIDSLVLRLKKAFASKMERLSISKTLLKDVEEKKSIAQSTTLRKAWSKIAHDLKKKTLNNEQIIPHLAQSGKDIVMQFPVEKIAEGSYTAFLAQVGPFLTDQGEFVSHLPSVMLLMSDSAHHHIYSSDLAQCDELEQRYTCQKEILDRPLLTMSAFKHIWPITLTPFN